MLSNKVNNNIELLHSTNNIFLEYNIKSKNNDNIVFCTSLIKKLYDDCLYHDKAKEISKLIKNRKINFNESVCLENSTYINDYYSFNPKLIHEYKNQATKNIYFFINNILGINNAIKKILSYANSRQRFIHVVRLLLKCCDDYPLFVLKDSPDLILKQLHKIKSGAINDKQLVSLFKEIVRNIGIEEAEILTIFYKAIQLWLDNYTSPRIELIDFLAISLYWVVELTNRTKTPLKDKICIFDPLILLTIHDLGYNPWLLFTVDDIDFNQICKMNRLLVQCIDIHFSKIPCINLAKIFVDKKNQTINSYLYFILARIMPLLWKDKRKFIKHSFISVEILPQTLLLATYKVFPEILATAILQKTKNSTTEFFFDENTFFIGEEFEFCDLQDKYFLFNNEHKVLAKWLEKAQHYFNQKGITDYSFANSLINNPIVSIGDWEYSLFKDGENLEINTTPYRNKDVFKIIKNNQEIQYTAYQLFDEFIHPLINFFGYSGISGHKHIDARSLNGNTELLLRLVIDYENNSWIPAAINRLEKCYNYYPYLTHTDNHFNLEIMLDLIDIINKKKQDLNYSSRYGDFDDLVYLSKLLNLFNIFTKHAPCALHHIINYNEKPEIYKKPTTTAEMRVFNFPQTGNESYLLNVLIKHRINYLLECQKRRELIEYNPVEPHIYYNKRNEVIAKFNKYVTECGLNPQEYKSLLRI